MLQQLFYHPLFPAIVKIALLIFVGLPAVYMCARMVSGYCTRRMHAHVGFIVSKLICYGGISYIILSILHECGFNITAFLGAAGVIGVAVGFASQTSMANGVAGIFLLFERAFVIGDEISSGGMTGKIESIDLFAITLRTSDNTLVRIPHEQVIKREMINLSYFAARKLLYTLILELNEPYSHAVAIIKKTCANQSHILAVHEIYLDEIVGNRYTIRVRISVNTADVRNVRESYVYALADGLRTNNITVHEAYLGTKRTSAESVQVHLSDQTKLF